VSVLLTHSFLGPLAAFLSAVTWALGSANYSKMIRDYRPFDVNFTRALFALPLFILAALITSGGPSATFEAYRALDTTHISWMVLSIVASYAIGDILFFMSTIALGVPGALAIASGFPILTALAAALIDHEMPTSLQWLGLFLAIAGMVLVILNGPKGTPPGEGSLPRPKLNSWLHKKWVGVALAALTAASWGTNSYSVAKGGVGVNPAIANSIRMAVALVLISILSLAITRTRARPMDRVAVKKYGWVFVLEAFFGSYLFVYGLSHSSVMLGSTLASLTPVVAVPIAVLLKLERFSWVRSLAVLTVVVGLSLLFR